VGPKKLKINFGTRTGNTCSESGFTGYIDSAYSSNLWIKTMQKYNTHHHVSLIFDKIWWRCWWWLTLSFIRPILYRFDNFASDVMWVWCWHYIFS